MFNMPLSRHFYFRHRPYPIPTRKHYQMVEATGGVDFALIAGRLLAPIIGSVPATPDPDTSAKVSRYKWEPYHDTKWWCKNCFLPKGGHTCVKVSQLKWEVYGDTFESIRVRVDLALLIPKVPRSSLLLFGLCAVVPAGSFDPLYRAVSELPSVTNTGTIGTFQEQLLESDALVGNSADTHTHTKPSKSWQEFPNIF